MVGPLRPALHRHAVRQLAEIADLVEIVDPPGPLRLDQGGPPQGGAGLTHRLALRSVFPVSDARHQGRRSLAELVKALDL
jgi:hypothetical protein